LESILVEAAEASQALEAVLFNFAGCNDTLLENEVNDIVANAASSGVHPEALTELLVNLNFVGPEVDDNRFEFDDDPQQQRRNVVLAQTLAAKHDAKPKFRIHPAFHAFLEIRGNRDDRGRQTRLNL
jgi:hypothetical protein